MNLPRCRRDFELLRGKLEYGGEGSSIRHGEHLEGQLRVRGQSDLERHFRSGGSHHKMRLSEINGTA
jgi:hypothetical protein